MVVDIFENGHIRHGVFDDIINESDISTHNKILFAEHLECCDTCLECYIGMFGDGNLVSNVDKPKKSMGYIKFFRTFAAVICAIFVWNYTFMPILGDGSIHIKLYNDVSRGSSRLFNYSRGITIGLYNKILDKGDGISGKK